MEAGTKWGEYGDVVRVWKNVTKKAKRPRNGRKQMLL